MDAETEALVEALAERLTCRNCPAMNTRRGVNLPGRRAMVATLRALLSALFPGCLTYEPIDHEDTEGMRERLRAIAEGLTDQIARIEAYRVLEHSRPADFDCEGRAREVVRTLFAKLPEIRSLLQDDVLAAYEGDPAAHSNMEIVMAYPGLMAVATHRVAHVLYEEGVHLLPRVMSEYAHSRTGIDIHPGATIGRGFFIDHGTGVVIGETCVIGRNVKLYQGVTLGARSFQKDSEGRLVKGIKRHPNVEDDVIIYANATILGGDTVIGKGSIIGGNVWLAHSVPPGSRIFYKEG
ncbi:MAG TPA: serine acetyltransferase [Candidatus Spyradenecus faecavium]|uniref:Serine acetyltransferase n=1 Tax=Candidatus Spyradenecus faecavium TaxID=2840947 RepID=A0A9D1NPU0_9BACT|nr:serine acetyltransferase [Candidatus Spyradenecus faecavium]